MVVVQRQTKVPPSSVFFCAAKVPEDILPTTKNEEKTKMPKTLLEKIVFTLVMAAIMVYGMIYKTREN